MELLQIADAVSREKDIDKEIVVEAIEEAIARAGRTKYGAEQDIRAELDRKTGQMTLRRYRTVTEEEEIENESAQITLDRAKRIKKDAKMGDVLTDDLPAFDYGRIAAQSARQVIIQKVRDAERERQFEEFKDKVGEIINGTVKRVEYGNATIDLSGKAEAILRRDESIPRENLNNGDRVRAYIYDVRREQRGPQIFVSRSHPQFMAELFKQEVPEIYEGIIEVKSVARDPGSRAKITVQSQDSTIDPVGACVGMRGSRVQAVVNELRDEKIDIITHSEDLVTLAIKALAPAEVSRVVVDEEANRIDVVVGEDQLSKAIGRRGQNVRLASILLGWDIDVLTEAEESERRQKEFAARTGLFIDSLDVDEVLAQLLVAEGFTSIEELAETPVDEFEQIEGLDSDIGEALKERAEEFLKEKEEQLKSKQKELGITDDLISLEGLNADLILKLGEQGVKSRDDLADLAGDELIEMLGENTMTEADANDLIMRARAHWFADEENQDQAEDSKSEDEAA